MKNNKKGNVLNGLMVVVASALIMLVLGKMTLAFVAGIGTVSMKDGCILIGALASVVKLFKKK